MTFALGATSLSRCTHVDPRLIHIVKQALLFSTVDFGFTEEQSRTAADQQHKFDTGVSKVRPGPTATHMIQTDGFSKAVDCVPWIDGKFQWGDNQWRVSSGGQPFIPFYPIAAAMRQAAIAVNIPIRWGAVWDRLLNNLPAAPEALAAEVTAYKTRHQGPDFLDAVHFELRT